MINPRNYEKPLTNKEVKQLKILREIITDSKLPPRNLDHNLLVATFNIREFGARKRSSMAIDALAELVSNFDVIAVQELKSDLNDLRRLMNVLGPYWKVVFNDPAGNPMKKGSDERLAYIFDGRVVKFTGMAAELLISDDFLDKTGLPKSDMSVPWRTPYMVSFRAGTFDFMLITVHIQWNSSGGINARTKEISMIANWIKERRDNTKLYDPDVFVLDDFNIPSLRSKTYKALIDNGLTIPEQLQNIISNLKQDAHYDQVAYIRENTS